MRPFLDSIKTADQLLVDMRQVPNGNQSESSGSVDIAIGFDADRWGVERKEKHPFYRHCSMSSKRIFISRSMNTEELGQHCRCVVVLNIQSYLFKSLWTWISARNTFLHFHRLRLHYERLSRTAASLTDSSVVAVFEIVKVADAARVCRNMFHCCQLARNCFSSRWYFHK